MGKRNPAAPLLKAINTMLSIPNLIDKFVKEHPHLLETEAFVEATLGLKKIITESRVIHTLIYDTVAKFLEEDDEEN